MKRGLFLKYVVLFVGLVAGVLVINAALDMYFIYQDNKRASIEVQREKAEAAARPSLSGVSGEATTVERAGKGDFAKVGSSAYKPVPAGAKSYKVSRGDTLSSIARKHSVEVTDLRRWNHLTSDQVKPGQTLVVSAR